MVERADWGGRWVNEKLASSRPAIKQLNNQTIRFVRFVCVLRYHFVIVYLDSMKSLNPDQLKKLQDASRGGYLIAGFIRQTLTTEESEELDEWISESDENMRLFGQLTDEQNIAASLAAYEKIDVEKALQQVKNKIKDRKRTKRFWQYTIAASVLLALGLTLFLLQKKQEKAEARIVKAQDIPPGEGKASLTLEDGTVIILGNKDTTIQSINVSASMNQISYSGLKQSPESFHTLHIPRKAHFSIVLDDGTKVWLNSGSSIRYPASFHPDYRMVYVTGETYFEVAKDPARPFRVMAGDMLVQALGTQFNINIYDDEPSKTATLVEGKVKVFVPGDSLVLAPGEQLLVGDNGVTKRITDLYPVTAWKNNQFRFRNTELSVIMRQLSRWYDAEIEYREPVSMNLNATIDRSEPVSKILALLQATGEVKFEIKSNKIIVSK
jgi:transmembrane sensor